MASPLEVNEAFPMADHLTFSKIQQLWFSWQPLGAWVTAKARQSRSCAQKRNRESALALPALPSMQTWQSESAFSLSLSRTWAAIVEAAWHH